MSFHSAFRPLYLSARAVTAEVCGVAGSSSTSQIAADRRPKARRRLEAADTSFRTPHAPHGSLLTAAAGPSRCFCTSHAPQKASELPLESFHPDTSQDPYEARDHSHITFWPSPSPSPRRYDRSSSTDRKASRPVHNDDFLDELPAYIQPPPIQTKEPPIRSRTADDFFTSTVPRIDPNEFEATNSVSKKPRVSDPPLYIDSLDPLSKNALLDHAMVLIKSGERSLPALLEECTDQLETHQREQVGLAILRRCLDEKSDARVVSDLYDSWTQGSGQPYIPPSGPTRYALRNMQSSTLYRCCTYLRLENLPDRAAVVAGDPRLKPSQSRFLIESLIFQLRPPRTLEVDNASDMLDVITPREGAINPPSVVDTPDRRALRSTLHNVVTTMRRLMANGVSFKRETLQHTLKMLCLTRSHRNLLHLFTSAQMRAKVGAAALSEVSEGHATGRRNEKEKVLLEIEDVEVPAIVSTRALEKLVILLSTQHASGLRTAFELVQLVPASQRTRLMYDHLMKMYGSVPIDTEAHQQPQDAHDDPPPTSTNTAASIIMTTSIEPMPTSNQPTEGGARDAVAYRAMDMQLWQEMRDSTHLQRPTAHTISSRIECHARGRRWDLVQSDIQYLRKQKLGTIRNLSENAQFALLRCGVETGALLAAYRLASVLLSGTSSKDVVYRTNVLNTLLVSAQKMQLNSPTAASQAKAISPTTGSVATDLGGNSNASAESDIEGGTPESKGMERRSARRQPSRTQLLKRFLNHFTGLLRKHPELQPTMETLYLLIQLLTKNHAWVSTPVLWNMVQIVSAHFDTNDRRSVPILEAFAHVFASRKDEESKRQVLKLIKDIEASTSSCEATAASEIEPSSGPSETTRQKEHPSESGASMQKPKR